MNEQKCIQKSSDKEKKPYLNPIMTTKLIIFNLTTLSTTTLILIVFELVMENSRINICF